MKQGKRAEAIAAFREAHDHAQPGSDLARLIERAPSDAPISPRPLSSEGGDRKVLPADTGRRRRIPTVETPVRCAEAVGERLVVSLADI